MQATSDREGPAAIVAAHESDRLVLGDVEVDLASGFDPQSSTHGLGDGDLSLARNPHKTTAPVVIPCGFTIFRGERFWAAFGVDQSATLSAELVGKLARC